jgi:hypothetical protein
LRPGTGCVRFDFMVLQVIPFHVVFGMQLNLLALAQVSEEQDLAAIGDKHERVMGYGHKTRTRQ